MDVLLNKPRVLQAITGLKAEEFEQLVFPFEAEWQRRQRRRTAEGARRQRAPGGGRHGTLSSIRHKLVFILLYFRVYPLQEVLGLLFGLSQPQACEWVHRLSPVLQAALGRELHLPERRPAKLHEVLSQCPQLEFFVDGTERRVRRPQAEPAQRQHYSGKKKTHTKKNVVIVAQRKVRCLSATQPGHQHDKTITEVEWAGRRFPARSTVVVDHGFAGWRPAGAAVVRPIKKPRGRPLDEWGQRINRAISRVRVVVEHVLSGVKRSRIVGEVFRNFKAGFVDRVMEVACGLHNFRTTCRASI